MNETGSIEHKGIINPEQNVAPGDKENHSISLKSDSKESIRDAFEKQEKGTLTRIAGMTKTYAGKIARVFLLSTTLMSPMAAKNVEAIAPPDPSKMIQADSPAYYDQQKALISDPAILLGVPSDETNSDRKGYLEVSSIELGRGTIESDIV